MAGNNIEAEAWMECEIAFSDVIVAVGNWKQYVYWDDRLSFRQTSITREHYSTLHNSDEGYKNNNWLLDDIRFFLRPDIHKLVEVGCGNGRFAKTISKENIEVICYDWVQSPEIDLNWTNVEFRKDNVINSELPNCDAVCSSDFLEHLSINDMEALLKKFRSSSMNQYHVIACYDDNHSHLTVMRPAAWLALFKGIFPDASFHVLKCRRESSKHVVCTIVTGLFNAGF